MLRHLADLVWGEEFDLGFAVEFTDDTAHLNFFAVVLKEVANLVDVGGYCHAGESRVGVASAKVHKGGAAGNLVNIFNKPGEKHFLADELRDGVDVCLGW